MIEIIFMIEDDLIGGYNAQSIPSFQKDKNVSN